MPEKITAELKAAGVDLFETGDLAEVIGRSDVIYWTRIQEERFPDPAGYAAVKDSFIMTMPVLGGEGDAILMHPLPRKHEMGTPADHDELDADPR